MPVQTPTDFDEMPPGNTAGGLEDQFPYDAEMLHRLRLGDAYFCNLAARYHALNRAIHRFETEVERCSAFHVERLKTQRLKLLDEITAILEQAEQRLVAP
ncbi:YdcH family protein [Erythrobacter sp. GH1-10]|uniref:YdcH family protein n=1 Tax=Erythrobacter sp. GH1-10 TaxID=3349334 RepID=UPI003877FAEF